MALTPQQPRWTITVRDASESASLMRGYRARGGTAASDMSALLSLASSIAPLTTGVITRASISYIAKDPDIPQKPSESPISRLARYVFQLDDDSGAFMSLVLPYKDDWVLTTGDLAGVGIDLENSEVIALTDAIVDNDWLDPFGANIGPLVAAYIEASV